MTAPLPPPPDRGPMPVVPTDERELAVEIDAVSGALLVGDGSRLARATRLVSGVIVLLAVPIVATGAAALLVGLAAWHDPLIEVPFVLALVAPALVAPILVARHALLLGRAAGHPRQLVTQAQDLVSRLQTSPELRSLATSIIRRRAGGASGARGPGGRGRRGLRGALSTTRLLTTVVGLAGPDKDRHPLLMGFTPARMRVTWLAFWWALWGWLLAAIVLFASAARLAVG